MVMCSDFSLKALISEWKEGAAPLLGPNPFVQLGTFSGNFGIAFQPTDLAASPSPQLQKVGELCSDKGKAAVHALSDSIIYSVDKEKADNEHYRTQVLTVCHKVPSFDVSAVKDEYSWAVDPVAKPEAVQPAEKEAGDDGKKSGGTEEQKEESKGLVKGVAAHVLLTYPSGGQLLTSMGHWLELTKLDVSEEALLRVYQTSYGENDPRSAQMRQDLSTKSGVARAAAVQSWSAQMVQTSAPCGYSKGYGKSKGGGRKK